jgi:enoyl-CoA hydratase/carnithine racemase
LMLAERLSADALAAHGLVHEVCEPGQAENSAQILAQRLAERAANANTSIKQLINAAANNSLAQQLDLEREHFASNLHHANAGIGIDAFLRKVKPDFD